MPPTFKTTEEATDTLIAASKGLREEPDKKDNRMLLLDGARGTLCSIHCIATSWRSKTITVYYICCTKIVAATEVNKDQQCPTSSDSYHDTI